MIVAAIDSGALLKMLYSSAIAGVAVTIVFALAILGATRSGDMRRAGRAGAATAYAALAGIGLMIAAAVVVYGVILVARKS
jgi:hypothetical protein